MRKIFQTKILEKSNGQILPIIVLMIELSLKLQMKIVD